MGGFLDFRGRPVARESSGKWPSAFFIIWVEVAERSAYCGIASNLINYLTGPLGMPMAQAAAVKNLWSGMSYLFPFLGAVVADSYLGRYKTIVFASLLYLLGLMLLTFSTIVPSLYPDQCVNKGSHSSCPPTRLQLYIFYFSLYLIALAQGGHKPCVQAFGAEQFDESDPEECKSMSSFFNWWYFGLCGGASVSIFVLSYVQDNIGWGLGFGIPCGLMSLALIIFLLGSKTYRCYPSEGKNPFVLRKIGFLEASNEEEHEPLLQQSCTPFEDEQGEEDSKESMKLTKLIPIWAICALYALILAQPGTFFTKQASEFDRRIYKNFQLPSASLNSLIGLTIVAFMPIYDRAIVPLLRKVTKIPSGITMLQRTGIGLALSILPMVFAALVETRRLRVSGSHLSEKLSLWWLVPQYTLLGIADVFTTVGLQEFFYNQVPNKRRSLGLAMYLSIFGVGEFGSGILVYIVDKITRNRGESWLSSDLNHARLDYYYWLLACMGVIEFLVYVFLARLYTNK